MKNPSAFKRATGGLFLVSLRSNTKPQNISGFVVV